MDRLLSGQEGFEPPTRGFGDRCSTVGATGLETFPGTTDLDLTFLVVLVLAAPRAELAQLELVLALPLVLRGRVVPLLAHRALERNDGTIALRHDLPHQI